MLFWMRQPCASSRPTTFRMAEDQQCTVVVHAINDVMFIYLKGMPFLNDDLMYAYFKSTFICVHRLILVSRTYVCIHEFTISLYSASCGYLVARPACVAKILRWALRTRGYDYVHKAERRKLCRKADNGSKMDKVPSQRHKQNVFVLPFSFFPDKSVKVSFHNIQYIVPYVCALI